MPVKITNHSTGREIFAFKSLTDVREIIRHVFGSIPVYKHGQIYSITEVAWEDVQWKQLMINRMVKANVWMRDRWRTELILFLQLAI